MSVDMLQADEELEPKSEPWLSIIKKSAVRGSELIKQVLVFAHGTGGERVEIELRHLILESIKILNETLPKNVTVRYDIPRSSRKRSIWSSPIWQCRSWTARRRFRALRRLNPELKIIAASGLTDQQKDDIKDMRTNAFLTKPITAEKLLTTVADVLANGKNL